MPELTRALGMLTAGYGVAVLLRPAIFAKPCALLAEDGSVPPPIAALARAIGVRDLASGISLAVLPAGRSLWAAIALRSVADFADAVLFGTAIPNPTTARRAAIGAASWGVLCALSPRVSRRRADLSALR